MAKHRSQSNQLGLQFEETPLSQMAMSPGCAAIIHAHLPPPVLPPIKPYEAEKPNVPAWDFRDVFPSPVCQANKSGTFGESPPTPAQIKANHVERANALLALLDDLAVFEKAKSECVNPSTKKRPKASAARKHLQAQVEREPMSIQNEFDEILNAYAEGFGREAAYAFADWVRNAHRNQLPRPK